MHSGTPEEEEVFSDEQDQPPIKTYRSQQRQKRLSLCLISTIMGLLAMSLFLAYNLAASLQSIPSVSLSQDSYSHPPLSDPPTHFQASPSVTSLFTLKQSFKQLTIGESSPENMVEVERRSAVHMAYRRTMRQLDYNTSVKLLKNHQHQPISDHSPITISQYLKAIQRLQLTVHSIGDISPQATKISQQEQLSFKKKYASGIEEQSICVVMLLSRKGMQSGTYQYALRGLFQQRYRNFKAVIIDNTPEMGMEQNIVNLLRQLSDGKAILLDRIQKETDYGQAGAFYYAAHHYCKDSSIILLLHDRGQLIGQTVFSVINEAHQKTDSPLVVSKYLLDAGKALVQMATLRYKIPLYPPQNELHPRTESTYNTKYLKSYKTEWLLELPQSVFVDGGGHWQKGLFEAHLEFAILERSCQKSHHLQQILYLGSIDDLEEPLVVEQVRRQKPLICRNQAPKVRAPQLQQFVYQMQGLEAIKSKDRTQVRQSLLQHQQMRNKLLSQRISSGISVKNKPQNPTQGMQVTNIESQVNRILKFMSEGVRKQLYDSQAHEQLIEDEQITGIQQDSSINQLQGKLTEQNPKTPQLLPAQKTSFCILLTTDNNRQDYEYLYLLESIFKQDYSNYVLNIIDNASADKTAEFIKLHLGLIPKEQKEKTRLYRAVNAMKKGQLMYWGARWLCRPHQVIIVLSGDQEIASSTVLSQFNKVYLSSNSLRVSYGSSIHMAKDEQQLGISGNYLQKTIEEHQYRSSPLLMGQLSSFTYEVFSRIRRREFLNQDEEWTDQYQTRLSYALLQLSCKNVQYIPSIMIVTKDKEEQPESLDGESLKQQGYECLPDRGNFP